MTRRHKTNISIICNSGLQLRCTYCPIYTVLTSSVLLRSSLCISVYSLSFPLGDSISSTYFSYTLNSSSYKIQNKYSHHSSKSHSAFSNNFTDYEFKRKVPVSIYIFTWTVESNTKLIHVSFIVVKIQQLLHREVYNSNISFIRNHYISLSDFD